MSRFVGEHLTAALLARLSIDQALARADEAVILCSVDEHGWPHPAMLSSLELVARDARNVRLAMHVGSRTTRNLVNTGTLSLIVVMPPVAYYIKGDVLLLNRSLTSMPQLASFNLRVDSVLEDNPQEYETARITSGIRIERQAIDESAARTLLHELTADAPESS